MEDQLIDEADAASRTLAKLLRAFGTARARRQLTADETLIFLAVGHLGLSKVCGGLSAKPVACPDVSSLLKIPKETVRRKTARLVKLDLVSMSPYGITLENIDEWCRVTESFAALTD
jgi:hypothetical protein